MEEMRDPARIDEIIEVLHKAWLKHPDWRLGQLIQNAGTGPGAHDVFFVEDDVMKNGLKYWAGTRASGEPMGWSPPGDED